tara:strand:+ start:954 stop:1220 length:267 start_codon:yes stop_codon:yes gene_type:complete
MSKFKWEYELSGFYCDEGKPIPNVSHAVIFSENNLTPIEESEAILTDGVFDFPNVILDETPEKFACVIEYGTNKVLGMVHVYDPEVGA